MFSYHTPYYKHLQVNNQNLIQTLYFFTEIKKYRSIYFFYHLRIWMIRLYFPNKKIHVSNFRWEFQFYDFLKLFDYDYRVNHGF